MSKVNSADIGFFRKIKKTKSCWIFTGLLLDNGYGHIKIGGVDWAVHRLSYVLHNGAIDRGMCVLHKCDVRSCVNPKHLYLGTHKDNASDRVVRGRSNSPRGSDVGTSKLTEKDVNRIRTSNQLISKLARKYDVSESAISLIKNRKRWRHLI